MVVKMTCRRYDSNVLSETPHVYLIFPTNWDSFYILSFVARAPSVFTQKSSKSQSHQAWHDRPLFNEAHDTASSDDDGVGDRGVIHFVDFYELFN